jgi:AraC family transcriptional regulator
MVSTLIVRKLILNKISDGVPLNTVIERRSPLSARLGVWMPAAPFEKGVAKQFRLTKAPTLFAKGDAGKPIAFTRLRAEGSFRGPTIPIPAEESFTFQVAMGPMATGDIWIDGHHTQLKAAQPGDTFVYDLSSLPVANLMPPFDFVRFYLPVRTMDQLAYDCGLRPVRRLVTNPSAPAPDPIMYGLAHAVASALENLNACSALFLDAVALAFHAHAIDVYGGTVGKRGATLPGLAPWQFRRIEAFIEAHLDGNPSIVELARECGLSSSHFARAFGRTTGMPPHRWLMKRRVERAKQLLAIGELELAQIALTCGFVDQSHLNRVFTRFEGCGPGRWRWLRRH